MRIIFVLILTLLISACSKLEPIECDNEKIKETYVDIYKRSLAVKVSMMSGRVTSPVDLKWDVTSIKTLAKDEENPFYRKCEVSLVMSGMYMGVTKIYEINKTDDDIVVKLAM
ncbi:hypothetical protein [Pectobacterium sp. B1J-3]|uniref:hypothetical protein n=1 Tax=Pectobacterium sp. B1J-3 TaxID=3385371 RepID=UPI003906B230